MRELSDEITLEWQLLMSAIYEAAKKHPQFKVKILEDKTIVINDKWRIICRFINYAYIDAQVSIGNESYLNVRNVNGNKNTTNIILNYINLNDKYL